MGPAEHSTRQFIVAFNRDRDSYQVPLALHSAGMLRALVTDFYAPEGTVATQITPKRLRHRRVAGLPGRLVIPTLGALGLQIYHHMRRTARDNWFMQVDAMLSRKTAAVAARSSADLLLYAQYAQEAFKDRRLSGRLKGLFVYHPHASLSRAILEKDLQNFPECAWSFKNAIEIDDRYLLDRLDAEIEMADFIFCASSFTRRSLIFHGVPSEKICVVPYGTGPVERPRPHSRDAALTRFLFVGQGMQRKGLHHLLRAWKEARLGNAVLRVICSRLDPGFRALLDQPNVQFSATVSRAELLQAFSSSHVFVMPSLVEGFGLVYLEALAAGCFVLATPNTGVPDLELSAQSAQLVEPTDVEALTAALRHVESLRSAGLIDHEHISREAAGLSWERFRERIVSNLQRVCAERH